MGKGGGGTTTTSSNSPPPQVLAQYENVIAGANQVAATPYTTGGFNASNLVAGFTPDQQSAFNTIDNSQGIAQPYINQASNYINASTQPLWNGVQQFSPNAVQQYQSPYTQNVLNTTQAAENNQDAIQQQGVVGNAISSGAWGGDRSAVAQAQLAGQQAIANNQTNAGIENQGYTQGLQEFNTQQQAQLGANEANQYLNAQAGLTQANLGTTAQNAALTGASAQLTSGNQQQTLDQSQLNVPYEQFLAQQAYPFQTTGWLSNISTGVGGSSGGTSSTTTPAPNSIFGFERGGGVKRYAPGGFIPLSDSNYTINVPDPSQGFSIALPNIPKGMGPPTPPKPQDQSSPLQQIEGVAGLAKNVNGLAGQGGISGQLSGLFGGAGGDAGAGDTAALTGAGDTIGVTGAADAAASTGFLSGLGDMAAAGGSALMDLLPALAFLKKGGSVPQHFDDGGATAGGMAPPTTLNPQLGGQSQGYASLSVEQLRQLATKIPPTSPQSQIVQKLIQQKTMMPNVGQPASNGLAPAGQAPQGFADGGSPDDNGPNSTPPSDTPPGNGFSPSSGGVDTSKYHITDAPPINAVSPWLSVATGLATALSGRSPYVGQNLASGVAAGLSNYGQQKTEAAKESVSQGDLQAKAEQLANQAEEAKNTLSETHARDLATASNNAGLLANQVQSTKQMGAYQAAEAANMAAQRKIQQQIADQGKVGVDPTGLRYYTSGPNAGQPIPNQEGGTNAQVYADNIGVPLIRPQGKEDLKKSTDAIDAANNNIGAANDGITSLQRIKTLLPTVDQGKMSEAYRYIQKAVGSGSTVEDATNQALPPGTPERAAYEEMQKLEMNAALQNEVANGIKGRALGINMVQLGQKMFANPEMSKVAQENIVDKSLYNAQMSKNANEVVQPFVGHSSATLGQVRSKYYNDSMAAGYAIPTQDYLSGDWKKPGYKQSGSQTYSPSGNNALPAGGTQPSVGNATPPGSVVSYTDYFKQ